MMSPLAKLSGREEVGGSVALVALAGRAREKRAVVDNIRVGGRAENSVKTCAIRWKHSTYRQLVVGLRHLLPECSICVVHDLGRKTTG